MGRRSSAKRNERRMAVMLSCPRTCRQAGCRQPAERDGSGFCKEHVGKNDQRDQRNFARRYDAVGRMYSTTRWTNFRAWILRQRPLCQRIVAGKPCLAVGKILHHLISPRQRPDLFINAENCVVLCEHCHPPDEGTPWWKPGVDYVCVASAKDYFSLTLKKEP